MSEKLKRNISGLLQHTAALKRETEDKVNQAIETLKRSRNKKINFKTVSELSGVSTTTLYNNPTLRERISSLRAVKKVNAQEIALNTSVQDRESELRRQIQKLIEEKKMLIEQLVELEALRVDNKRLKALLNQRQLE